MATTTAGRELTEQHRTSQLGVRAGAARDVTRLMAAYDWSDIDGSWLAVAPGMEAVVRDYRRQSAGVAGGYYQAFRTAEGVGGSSALTLAQPPPAEALRYSLGFYGRIVPKQLIQRGTQNVAGKSLALMIGGATRHVLDGGRGTLVGSVQQDRQAIGHVRVTAGNPCAFCAMLASRGVVYKRQSFAASDVRFEGQGEEKVHDTCACTVEPVYSSETSLPGRAEEFSDLWQQHAKGAEDPMNAFRRAYERPSIHA